MRLLLDERELIWRGCENEEEERLWQGRKLASARKNSRSDETERKRNRFGVRERSLAKISDMRERDLSKRKEGKRKLNLYINLISLAILLQFPRKKNSFCSKFVAV